MTRHVDLWHPASGQVMEVATTPRGDALPQRWQHSAVSCDGVLWLYGGHDAARGPSGCLHALSLSAPPDGLETSSSLLCRAVELERDPHDTMMSVEVALLHWRGEGPALTGHTARLWDGESVGESESVHRADPCMIGFGGKGYSGTTNLLWRVSLPAAPATTATWRLLEAGGAAPSPRYCHSADSLATGWLIFGGWQVKSSQAGPAADEQSERQLNGAGSKPFLNDLHLLELPGMRWSQPAVAGAVPRARCQAVMAVSSDEQIMLIFGGACHRDPKPGQVYGDMVMDLCDVALLHMPTLTWLPQRELPTHYSQRGGTNALVRAPDGRCFIFGGMNSDEGHDTPRFLCDMTEMVGLEAGAASAAALVDVG